MQIKMGCDPELFVTDAKGTPKSAYGLIPGTKESPHKVNKGAIQVDGMALEFNIDPVESEEEWVDNISTVMRELRAATPDKYKFLVKPSVRFNGNHLNAQPDEAKELGCMPDFDAYTLAENPRPDGNTTLRTASGHIHIGFREDGPIDEEHTMRCATLAKHLDLFLGVRSLEWDKDKTRRQLYGNAGAIRIKPYGLEYRVLSNAWLDREELVRFVYKQTLACIDDLKTNGALPDHLGYSPYSCAKNSIAYGQNFYVRTNGFFTDTERGKQVYENAMKLEIK